jgi:hypothetical protein
MQYIRPLIVACVTCVVAICLSNSAQASCTTSDKTTTCTGNVYPYDESVEGGTDLFTYIFEGLTENATGGSDPSGKPGE